MQFQGLKSYFILTLSAFCVIVSSQQITNNEIYPREPIVAPPRQPSPDINLVNNNDRWGGMINSAKTFVASPAGQLAVTMAKEFISRSAGGGQILSLNLQSLLVLVLLKGLIFLTGMVGVGNYSQFGRGRLLDGNSFVSNSEMQFFTGFLAAEGSGQDGCLYRSVCMAPEMGAEYMKAGIALLEGYGAFDPNVTRNARYNEYLQNIQNAVYEGMQNAPCDNIYSCNI